MPAQSSQTNYISLYFWLKKNGFIQSHHNPNRRKSNLLLLAETIIRMLNRPNGEAAEVSLQNYKINFNDKLGDGAFASGVYGLVPRPLSEQGWLSLAFPYFYDWFYPIKDKSAKSPYCVKVFRTFPDLMCSGIQSLGILDGILTAIIAYFGPRYEAVDHQRLLKAKLTTVKLNASGFFYHVKDKIIGETLKHYIRKGILFYPEQYLMRQSLYQFLLSLKSSEMRVSDLHLSNVMFNENTQAWEVCDALILEIDFQTQLSADIASQESVDELLLNLEGECPDKAHYFKQLERMIFHEVPWQDYTPEQDSKITLLPKTPGCFFYHSNIPPTGKQSIRGNLSSSVGAGPFKTRPT